MRLLLLCGARLNPCLLLIRLLGLLDLLSDLARDGTFFLLGRFCLALGLQLLLPDFLEFALPLDSPQVLLLLDQIARVGQHL